jgi:hypothetical protein
MVDVEFIRLFFPDPAAEKIACKCARLLAAHIGHRAMLLRPETTLSEIAGWIEISSQRNVNFIMALENELGFELDEFLNDFHHVTFRDLVEHAAWRQPKAP